MKEPPEVLGAISETVSEAEKAFDIFINAYGDRNADYRAEQRGIVEYYIDRAFLELRLFLEARGLPQMLRVVAADHTKAKKNLMASESSPWGDIYSFWAGRLRQYISAVGATFGSVSPSTITKDVVEILRATVYSITDEGCFPTVPKNEADVHTRIEAVLRCVFPTLRHKPSISKPIKNFEPDTGLPSVKTLIEYKFVSSKEDVKRVADEVLADTRAYVTKEWSQFVYVIYETRRLRPETQWNELLRTSGVAPDTQIIVISGQEPKPLDGRAQRPLRSAGRAKTPRLK